MCPIVSIVVRKTRQLEKNMRIIDKTIISDEITSVHFACDLPKCKGACCIEGDAGAPLEEEEISLLEDHIDEIKPFMRPGGIKEIERTGVFDYDDAGKYVTPLVEGKECAFVYFEDKIARCAVEKAYVEKAIPFRKPVSCHLYPIRIKRMKGNDAVNYHRWHICDPALEKGKKEKTLLYRFLEDAIIRKYGKAWFEKLLKVM
jgi:hypothetical protein